MDPQITLVLVECTKDSDEGRATFPQVIAKLMAAGVEGYHADLRRAGKTYYLPDGDSAVVPSASVATVPARDFSAHAVVAALRAIQAQAIDYRAFCERIAAAGCVGYVVSLPGRRAVYFGRTAETYVEMFPPAT